MIVTHIMRLLLILLLISLSAFDLCTAQNGNQLSYEGLLIVEIKKKPSAKEFELKLVEEGTEENVILNLDTSSATLNSTQQSRLMENNKTASLGNFEILLRTDRFSHNMFQLKKEDSNVMLKLEIRDHGVNAILSKEGHGETNRYEDFQNTDVLRLELIMIGFVKVQLEKSGQNKILTLNGNGVEEKVTFISTGTTPQATVNHGQLTLNLVKPNTNSTWENDNLEVTLSNTKSGVFVLNVKSKKWGLDMNVEDHGAESIVVFNGAKGHRSIRVNNTVKKASTAIRVEDASTPPNKTIPAAPSPMAPASGVLSRPEDSKEPAINPRFTPDISKNPELYDLYGPADKVMSLSDGWLYKCQSVYSGHYYYARPKWVMLEDI